MTLKVRRSNPPAVLMETSPAVGGAFDVLGERINQLLIVRSRCIRVSNKPDTAPRYRRADWAREYITIVQQMKDLLTSIPLTNRECNLRDQALSLVSEDIPWIQQSVVATKVIDMTPSAR